MLEIVKIVETSFKRSVHTLLHSVINSYIYVLFIHILFRYGLPSEPAQLRYGTCKPMGQDLNSAKTQTGA